MIDEIIEVLIVLAACAGFLTGTFVAWLWQEETRKQREARENERIKRHIDYFWSYAANFSIDEKIFQRLEKLLAPKPVEIKFPQASEEEVQKQLDAMKRRTRPKPDADPMFSPETAQSLGIPAEKGTAREQAVTNGEAEVLAALDIIRRRVAPKKKTAKKKDG